LEINMKSIRILAAACALLAVCSASAQTASAGAAKQATTPVHAASMPGGSASDRMLMMDKQMQSMRQMHDRMARARTPEERQALMAEPTKLMQEGMSMMGGMGPGTMGMGSMADRQQMMEKRMEMMQSMMQMMMDRLPAQPPAAK
jgi:hypothetical protein